MQIGEALQMQIEVQRRLHEQLEVCRRINFDKKYMDANRNTVSVLCNL